MDEKAEAEFRASIREVAYDAFLDLRETLKPGYDFKRLGYNSVEHARETIIKQSDRVITRMSSDHLKRQGV